MKIYKHSNYEEYLKSQVSANIIKQDVVWVSEKDIAMLCDYLRPMQPKQGLCHGTRNGIEQAYFRKYLDVAVLGTEISPLGVNYPDTIQWDFHEVKKEWLDNMDFIYSNSFDHSYNPVKSLNSWLSCLKPKGVCIIEWSHDIRNLIVTMLMFSVRLWMNTRGYLKKTVWLLMSLQEMIINRQIMVQKVSAGFLF